MSERIVRLWTALGVSRAVILLACLAGVAAVLVWPRTGATEETVPTPFSWTVSGLAAQSITPLGAAPQSGSGEIWGIASNVGVTTTDSAADGWTASGGQLVLVRQQGTGGWEYVSAAKDLDGKPIDFALGNTGPAIGRVTARGGVVLVAGDRVLVRKPGGALRQIEAPDDALLGGGELIGAGRVTFAAQDENDQVGAFFAPLDAVEDRVLHWDGTAWTREPVEVPGSPSSFTVAAIAAGSDGAWLVGTTGTGLKLFRRDPTGAAGPTWKPVSLSGVPTFATTSKARPLTHPAEGLTAVDGGRLWVDGAVEEGGTEYTFSLLVDTRASQVIRSWCNAPGLCDARLEFELSAAPAPGAGGDLTDPTAARQLGYRSFAWPGGTYGTRVVTNPRVDGQGDRGAYGMFDGATFRRVKVTGRRTTTSGQIRAFGAFSDASNGWLAQSDQSLIRVASAAPAPRLQAYPLPVRRPLKAVVAEPGRSPADPGAGALAVGYDGQVLRFNPAQGWLAEPLPSGSGRATPQLNAVAWPEARRAHAVGEKGAMWLYRAELGMWERDEGAPLDASEDRFVGIAFDAGDPNRGYAIAQEGRILRYGKSWETEDHPAVGELFGIAFAGSQALVVGSRGLLVNDGNGWRADPQVEELLKGGGERQRPLLSVAGLPDGGAVLAGRGIVLKRDSATAPWRVSEHPIDGLVTAVSAVRDGGTVRAVAIVDIDVSALGERDPIIDIPGEPPGIQPDRRTWTYGAVFRETSTGWVDEERSSYDVNEFADCPLTPEPALGMSLDANGEGWIVGGETGFRSPRRCELETADTATAFTSAQTAEVWRYGAAPAAPPALERVQAVHSPGAARILFGGNAECQGPCADLGRFSIGPDRNLSAAIDLAASLHATQGGPRALVYTGGRVAAGVADAARPGELSRFAEVLGGATGRVPLFVAPSATDAGSNPADFRAALAGLPAPQGSAAPGPGIAEGSGEGGAGARTFFAMDTTGPEGTLRVVVINNSAGSLEASASGQGAWLRGVLDEARARGIVTVVAGSRPLSGAGLASGDESVASDGAETARLLLDHGASAYLFDSPERNVSTRVPEGASEQLPAFGSGSLGYDATTFGSVAGTGIDPADNGLALLDVQLSARDPQTNRAPVSATVQPVIEDLAIDATDGVVVRRSSPALFSGLGRRPRAGTRRNADVSRGSKVLLSDPYISMPNPTCASGQCADRIPTEFTFTSSNPEIGDFVRVDPSQASTNPRAVFLGTDGKPVADPTSGLFCAFNPGVTTVSVVAGGLRYSASVQVLAGSPRQPCGTRPVAQRPEPTATSQPPSQAAAPVAAGAQANPSPAPPPPPAVAAVPPVLAAVTPVLTPPAPGPLPVLPPLPALPLTPVTPPTPLVVVPPPPVGGIGRPAPPGGATVRVYEEKREEEEAFEQSSAAVRYEPDRPWTVPSGAFTLVLLIVAAGAGSAIVRSRRRPRDPGLGYAGVRDRRH